MWALQVRWAGWDTEGRPLLVLRIAKASEECSGAQAEAVATAVISQVCLHGLGRTWCMIVCLPDSSC